MSDDRIAEIEAQLAAATPGPKWNIREFSETFGVYVMPAQDVMRGRSAKEANPEDVANVRLIQHMPGHLRHLLDRLRAAERDRERLRGALERIATAPLSRDGEQSNDEAEWLVREAAAVLTAEEPRDG